MGRGTGMDGHKIRKEEQLFPTLCFPSSRVFPSVLQFLLTLEDSLPWRLVLKGFSYKVMELVSSFF
jgi:hypothetical protein